MGTVCSAGEFEERRLRKYALTEKGKAEGWKVWKDGTVYRVTDIQRFYSAEVVEVKEDG